MPSVIWIIDRQQWPRAYLRAELIERGFEAIGFMELTDALSALLHPAYAQPNLIVLELCDLAVQSDELNVLARIRVPMIALGGAVEFNAAWVQQFHWAAKCRRPFTLGQVADLVAQLVEHV